MLGNFERCDLSFAESSDFFRRGRFAFLQPDGYSDLFSEFVMRYAVDRSVANLGMASQEIFNLARIDVFAAADDHLFFAATNRDVSVFILRRQITGAQPAIGSDGFVGGLRLVVIAFHDQVSAHPQLTGLVGRQW